MTLTNERACKKGRRGFAWAALAAVAVLAAVAAFLGAASCSSEPALAEGRPSTEGVCEVRCVNPGLGDDDANLFDVTMPDGQVLRGHCLDHGEAAPADGEYRFTGEWDGERYAIRIHTEGADPYEGQIWMGKCQAVGNFSWYPLGSIEVEKTSALPGLTEDNGCYSLAGAVYEVRDSSGALVGTVTTNGEGRGSLGGLPQGSYVVREVTAPLGFALDASEHRVEVAAGASRLAVSDVPQHAEVDVAAAKYDAELPFDASGNVAQGDATLAGAEFEVKLYGGFFESAEAAESSGELLRSWVLRTDEQGFARLADEYVMSGDALYRDAEGNAVLPLGTVCVREVTAPEGYLLGTGDGDAPNACVQVRGGDAAQALVAYNAPRLSDRVVRGDVSIVKFGDKEGASGDPAIKHPLAGVAFDVVHAETGEVAARIVTDDNGFATTLGSGTDGAGALPYGTYLVREDAETAPVGYAVVPEFSVTVAEDGRTYYYILEDTTGTAIRVVKQDAETGRQIARPMTFRILDEQMNVVSFTSLYPSVTVHTAFTTDATGACVLPERLNGGGTYYVQEISAPEGYVLSSEPVAFTLPGGGADFSSPVTVTLSDAPQKGRLEIQKVDADTGLPVPSSQVAWEVRAKNDVVTPDGTVRVTAGTVVAMLQADENGCAAVEGLYLGVYEVREVSAPEGYLLTSDVVTVELPYAGQDAGQSVVQLVFADQPATGSLRVAKYAMETGDVLPDAQFSVIAAEDIVTPDGTVRALAGDETARLTTGADGVGVAEGLFPGLYEVVEVSPAPGYVLDGQRYEVRIEQVDAGKACPMVDLEVENVPNRIELAKMDAASKEPLAGAVINWWNRTDEQREAFEGSVEVTGANGELAYVDESLMGSAVTDEEGLAAAERLAPGSYAFAETAAPEGYELDSSPQEVEVSEDGSIDGAVSAVLVFEDEPTPEPEVAEVHPLTTTGDSSSRAVAVLAAVGGLAAVALACAVRQGMLRRAG